MNDVRDTKRTLHISPETTIQCGVCGSRHAIVECINDDDRPRFGVRGLYPICKEAWFLRCRNCGSSTPIDQVVIHDVPDDDCALDIKMLQNNNYIIEGKV